MNNKVKFWTLATLTLAVSSLTVGGVVAQTRLTPQSKVSINGIGPVRVGMTVSQASQAAGVRFAGDKPNNSCYYVSPKGYKNLGFMVTENRIARVDVYDKSRITTVRGAKIGDTEARIKSLYPGQIQVSPHNYVPGGHYLTFVPQDRADRNYRVVFETDGKRVTMYRAGKLPEVEYVEGCS
ncbi:hypothetical protein [Nostoc sp. CMAA1605]|uniref:hypothetical protein n=1 Tax=Nostoc sp. CMAA1605 TaxID=2055159 RepID=UPI001F17102D|nr:hypothetical protein [Nostoc sp. CMAA1605]MCF4970071.1 hypothetical protein [Nostoc sp. CMAA1605]